MMTCEVQTEHPAVISQVYTDYDWRVISLLENDT